MSPFGRRIRELKARLRELNLQRAAVSRELSQLVERCDHRAMHKARLDRCPDCGTPQCYTEDVYLAKD